MSTLQSAILGFIQGVTEFLPISSSGHLVILNRLFGLGKSDNVAFIVLLHVATLLAVLVVFRRDIVDLFTSRRTELGMIVLGTVPTALVGFFLADNIKPLASSTLVVGAALMGTGAVVALAGLSMKSGLPKTVLTWKHALLIGAAQAAAMVPGLSRSGMTIAVAIMCGIALADAVRFSFLLAIPAIAGGALYELRDLGRMAQGGNAVPMAVGFILAFIFGVISLKLVAASVMKKKFPYFAFYCIPLGILVVALSLAGGNG